MSILITEQDFDLGSEVAQLRAGHPEVGAVVAFVGTVRDMNDGAPVAEMTLEHYPGMTEKSIQAIVDLARARWSLFGTRVIHRIGPLAPQAQIVLVAVTAAHRGDAFAACEFIMDYLKTEAPFWKKEQTPNGARWVDARVSDDAALRKWQPPGVSAGESLISFFAIAVGATLGAWLRWGLGLLLNAIHGEIPVGTLAANLGGGFLIGIAVAFFAGHPGISPAWRLFAVTGFLGGLTTFSSFSAESMLLLQRGEFVWAFCHALLHLVGALACCFAGFALYRSLTT